MRYLDNDLVHEHASGRGNSSGLTYAASVTNECGKRAGEGSRATVAVLLHPGSVSRLSGYYSAGVWVFGQQRSRGGAAGPAVGNQPWSTDRVEWGRGWALPSDFTAGGRICLGRVLCSNWPAGPQSAQLGQRDTPSPTCAFGAQSPSCDGPLVWQTFRGKVEIFLATVILLQVTTRAILQLGMTRFRNTTTALIYNRFNRPWLVRIRSLRRRRLRRRHG